VAFNILDEGGGNPPSLPSTFVKTGSVAIPNGADYVQVTGLAMATTPSAVMCTVRSPSGSGDLIMYACVRDDTVSTDGFIADISGAVDSTGYKLDYFNNGSNIRGHEDEERK